jgi:DNA-directed RNA polymerase subunit M/transcription elongation factor TFIIS
MGLKQPAQTKAIMKVQEKDQTKADESDKDDADFMGSSSDGNSVSENNDMDGVEITNVEVCFYLTLHHILFSELFSKLTDSLPSKTIPSGRSCKSKGKKPAWKRKHAVDTSEASHSQSVSQSTSKFKSGNCVTRKIVCFTLQIKLAPI